MVYHIPYIPYTYVWYGTVWYGGMNNGMVLWYAISYIIQIHHTLYYKRNSLIPIYLCNLIVYFSIISIPTELEEPVNISDDDFTYF